MKNHSFATRSTTRQLGLSLVELMIAMTLGLIVLAGVLSLFMTNKQSYTLENAVAQIQEGGRFSLDFMRPQLRRAGYTGCGGQNLWSSGMNLLNGTDQLYAFSQAIQGYDYNGTGTSGSYTISAETPALDNSATDWTPAIPNTSSSGNTTIWDNIKGYVIPGSDIIMIHSVNPGGVAVKPPSGGGGGSAGSVKVYDGNQISSLLGQIGYITNCQDAAVFQITNINVSSATVVHSKTGSYYPGNASQGKVDNMSAPAQMFTMQTYIYFIGLSADGQNPALYVTSLDNSSLNGSTTFGAVNLQTPQELVDGVENMQILYGVDTDADGIANQYVAASDITNWSTVSIVSVRIGLLVRSDSGAVPASSPGLYSIDNVNITAPAAASTTKTRRMRKIFTETITLRNHAK